MRCHEIKSEIRDSIISLAGAATSEIRDSIISLAGAATGTIFVATKLL